MLKIVGVPLAERDRVIYLSEIRRGADYPIFAGLPKNEHTWEQ